MSNLEFNKIFAAVLLAGIIGMLSGFVAKKVVVSKDLKEDAFPIEVADSGQASAKVEKPKGPEPILAMLATADPTRGEKLSKACAACHSFDKGGANRIGPNLWNVVGAEKAHVDGFTYSSTMAAFGGNWGYNELNHFLWKPKDYMKGTKMNYIGLRKPQDRADMIAWLRTLHDSPMPLPTITEEAPAAEEALEEAVEEDVSNLMSVDELNAIESAAGDGMSPASYGTPNMSEPVMNALGDIETPSIDTTPAPVQESVQ